jgi:hypothetical protein
MSGVGDSDTTMARRIRALKRGIEKSLMELTDVEVAINGRRYSEPVEGGGLERKRLRLTNLIVEMDAKLKRLQAQFPGDPDARRRLWSPEMRSSIPPDSMRSRS